MSSAYFITGTDTGAGKTWATVALLRHFQAQGKIAVGMKPVASGCKRVDGRLENEDALLLQRYSSLVVPYEVINPYAFEAPIAPHLAAADAGIEIDFENIGAAFKRLQAQADVVLVEGVGGWAVPLNAMQDVASLARYLDLPIIMVVAMRLGCINHARLTYQSIVASEANCAGWLAVCLDAHMAAQQQTISSLEKWLNAPLLGVLPYCTQVDALQNTTLLI